jgi:hypothetical protein
MDVSNIKNMSSNNRKKYFLAGSTSAQKSKLSPFSDSLGPHVQPQSPDLPFSDSFGLSCSAPDLSVDHLDCETHSNAKNVSIY